VQKVSSAISKTRKDLIDVARMLFAKNGVESTTMNDIAKASQRGRRTLYTYFSSKNDIYKAVIESELDVLYNKLEEVTRRDMPADDKLLMLAFTRLNAIKEVVTRNGTLKADFFRDIWQVETVRKGFKLESDEHNIIVYFAPEINVRFGDTRGQGIANMPKEMIAFTKKYENGLMMFMEMEDNSKKGNNMTMECIAFNESSTNIRLK
jgi:AcrR family transcriptional regulator